MYENIWRIMKENKFEIENEISNKLKCSICNELMIKACNAPCGCRFCFDCIENYLNGHDKFCPGKSKHCQKKMINYVNDIVIDNCANIEISEIIVKCPNKNCQFKNELSMIENHKRTCYKRSISCPYYGIGCEMNELINDEMKDHLIEDNYCHSKLLIDLINNLRTEMESMKNDIIVLRRENNQFKQKYEKIELQSSDEKQKIYQLERKEKEKATEIEKLNQEIVALKNENRSMKTEIQGKVESMNKMKQIIESSYQKNVEGKSDIELMKGKIDKICEENANFIIRLNYFDETFKEIFDGNLNNLQIKMIEMETKLENLEIDGEFEWTFGNLSQQERYTCIYSKPFYSWKFGYKFCLSILIGLFGDGIKVYFHLMRGDFDDKLAWPFKCSVTIDLMDQQIGNICNTHTEKYSDCPVKAAWSKPSKDINYGIRYHHIAINSAAVRNDQIIIKCKVKRNKINL